MSPAKCCKKRIWAYINAPYKCHIIIIVCFVLFYFVLFSQTHSSPSPCIGDVTCTNGCCKNNPCLNGGTWNEICETTSVRYNCSCPEPFAGRHCETWLRRTSKQLGPVNLDCLQFKITPIEPSKCSVILIQSLGSLGSWLSLSVCPTSTSFR